MLEYLILIFLSYFFLCSARKHFPIFLGISLIFLGIGYYFRIHVDYKSNADYYGYYLLSGESFSFGIDKILSEPYFPIIYDFFKKIAPSNSLALEYVYLFNFFICNLFFIWLAYNKSILFYLKIIFFSLYYFLFAYTAIRNSLAYLLVGVALYKMLRNSRFIFGYFAFLFHVSSLPVILSMFLGFKKPKKKVLIYILTGAISLGVIINLPIFSHILMKFDAYSAGGAKYNVAFHFFYFTIFNLVVLLIYFKNRKVVYNSYFIFVFILYLVLFILNPVMSFRYSIYLITFLCFYPYKISKFTGYINYLSIFLMFYFIYTFYSTHPNL